MREYIMNDLSGLNTNCIKTIQRTKTFYFRPVDGWKRGVDYRTECQQVVDNLKKLLEWSPEVQVVTSNSRYFEYYLITEVDNSVPQVGATDYTEALRMGVSIMLHHAKNSGLTITTVGSDLTWSE